jgi:uncharacterized protein (DUF58 family)
MLRAAVDRVGNWTRAWTLSREQPRASVVRLHRRRIYILPTRFGLAYGALAFAMLLGSMNYGANLGFLLTFLLCGLGLIAMHHCHRNLLGLEVRFAGARPVFVGESVAFRIALANDTCHDRYEVEAATRESQGAPLDVPRGTTQLITLSQRATRRGWCRLGRLKILTHHPGRLFRAWSPVALEGVCLVYPQPAPPGRPLPRQAAHDGSGRAFGRAETDFAGLRPAQPGDSPRRIAWKAYARSDELLLKEFSGAEHEPAVLDWNMLPELDTEGRLSQLTRWCLDAMTEGRPFGLILPGTAIPLGGGTRQLEQCLKVLALFQPPAHRGQSVA